MKIEELHIGMEVESICGLYYPGSTWERGRITVLNPRQNWPIHVNLSPYVDPPVIALRMPEEIRMPGAGTIRSKSHAWAGAN